MKPGVCDGVLRWLLRVPLRVEGFGLGNFGLGLKNLVFLLDAATSCGTAAGTGGKEMWGPKYVE